MQNCAAGAGAVKPAAPPSWAAACERPAWMIETPRLRRMRRSDIMRVRNKPGRVTMHAKAIGAVPAVRSEVAGAVAALLLGVFVVFMVGFAGPSVLHEAAHNTRHGIGFPCH